MLEAKVLVERWRTQYNTLMPYGSLNGLTPEEFRTSRAEWWGDIGVEPLTETLRGNGPDG